jgi:hypothetical protein
MLQLFGSSFWHAAIRGCVQRREKPDGENLSNGPGVGLGKAGCQVVQ